MHPMDKSERSMHAELKPLASLSPLTPVDCANFGTRRIHFNRRRSHQNKHLLILHLNGVIGTVNFIAGSNRNLGDGTIGNCLRNQQSLRRCSKLLPGAKHADEMVTSGRQ